MHVMFREDPVIALMLMLALFVGTPLTTAALLIQLWCMAFNKGRIINGSLSAVATILFFKFSRAFTIAYDYRFKAIEMRRKQVVMIPKKLLNLLDQNKDWSDGNCYLNGDYLVYGRTLTGFKNERNFHYESSEFEKLNVYFGSWPAFIISVVSLGALAAYFSRIDQHYMSECWLVTTAISFIFWRSLGRVNLTLANRRIEPLLQQLSPKMNTIPDYVVKNGDSDLYISMISLGISALILLKAKYLVHLLGLSAPGFRS